MLIQNAFEILYLTLVAIIISFIVLFYAFSRKAPSGHNPNSESKADATQTNAGQKMEKSERSWLYFLLAIVLIGNLVTLSPLVPSTNFGIWPQSSPAKTITIEVANYHFIMPGQPITVPVGKIVQFVVISHDVTYGFGVFRKDRTMVFQMQVVPEPYKNTLLWVFDQPGFYDVRSTEYSGPQNPFMFVPNAIQAES
jgi:heme/copper-type cytochrome/quinol oxidase subunit 2